MQVGRMACQLPAIYAYLRAELPVFTAVAAGTALSFGTGSGAMEL
jgi:hypothetical protein